ncbi:hypothetical protein VFA_000532 [Vibrio furnissii CIP 102972]|nr:hypothetical protein VFA_000532 [Vibrio furnissii CIP 102972]SUP43590.1 Uncharacterised protein [Vibrio furnissii]
MDKCEGERGVRIVVWSRANMMLLSRGGCYVAIHAFDAGLRGMFASCCVSLVGLKA